MTLREITGLADKSTSCLRTLAAALSVPTTCKVRAISMAAPNVQDWRSNRLGAAIRAAELISL
jgi:hypothetical protein